MHTHTHSFAQSHHHLNGWLCSHRPFLVRLASGDKHTYLHTSRRCAARPGFLPSERERASGLERLPPYGDRHITLRRSTCATARVFVHQNTMYHVEYYYMRCQTSQWPHFLREISHLILARAFVGFTEHFASVVTKTNVKSLENLSDRNLPTDFNLKSLPRFLFPSNPVTYQLTHPLDGMAATFNVD